VKTRFSAASTRSDGTRRLVLAFDQILVLLWRSGAEDLFVFSRGWSGSDL